MTSPKLQIILRQLKRQQLAEEEARAPADTSALGAAIESIIAQAVQQQVADAVAKEKEHHSSQVRKLMREFNAPAPSNVSPPPASPAAVPLEMRIERDGAGMARAININGHRYLTQRDSAGLLARLVLADQVADHDPTSGAGPERAADPTRYQPPKSR